MPLGAGLPAAPIAPACGERSAPPLACGLMSVLLLAPNDSPAAAAAPPPPQSQLRCCGRWCAQLNRSVRPASCAWDVRMGREGAGRGTRTRSAACSGAGATHEAGAALAAHLGAVSRLHRLLRLGLVDKAHKPAAAAGAVGVAQHTHRHQACVRGKHVLQRRLVNIRPGDRGRRRRVHGGGGAGQFEDRMEQRTVGAGTGPRMGKRLTPGAGRTACLLRPLP